MPWNTPKTNFANGDVLAASEMNAIGQNLAMFNGGTTGQVLAKTGSADGAWAWTSETDPNAIPKTLIDAKGDLIAGTAADTAGRLAVGTNGQVLTADSSTATGLKWASAAAGQNFTLLSSASLSSGQTVTISGISNANAIFIRVFNASTTQAGATIGITVNSDTGANYMRTGLSYTSGSSYSQTQPAADSSTGYTQWNIGKTNDNANHTDGVSGSILLWGCNSSGLKIGTLSGGANRVSGASAVAFIEQVAYSGSSTISSVSIVCGPGTFDNGTLFVYTSA